MLGLAIAFGFLSEWFYAAVLGVLAVVRISLLYVLRHFLDRQVVTGPGHSTTSERAVEDREAPHP